MMRRAGARAKRLHDGLMLGAGFALVSFALSAPRTAVAEAAAVEEAPSVGVGGASDAPEEGGRETARASAASEKRRQRPVGIEEMTVTARKRGERLQDAPLAVSAFAGADLQEFDVRRIQDISGSVPNLAFDTTAGLVSASRVNLRGIGNGDAIATDDPGVGIYLDGVYLARATGSLIPISDIERVEVLRGPQGTLFGKNTIGGAINVITRKLNLDDLGGNAEVRLGNFRRFDSRLSLNVPLLPERAAARVSFASATRTYGVELRRNF